MSRDLWPLEHGSAAPNGVQEEGELAKGDGGALLCLANRNAHLNSITRGMKRRPLLDPVITPSVFKV